MLPLGTGGGFGMHVSQHASHFRLAPNATPKLILIALLFALLVLWLWARGRSRAL
jgi:hypothetical protein